MADEEGATPLEVLQGAAKRDNFEIAQETIKNNAGIDVNSQDGLGNTVLHYFAQYGNAEAVEYLLAIDGLKLNAQNRQWNTPIHLAAENEQFEVVRLLIEKGANPQLKNKQKQAPVDIAGTDQVKELIQSAIFARQIDVSHDVAADSDDDEEDEE